ncbi:MAG TPA: M15 family metallopeptidase [Thermoanaerobaculia bacterium]|jgi:D-alanyl-D-alanine dipeptidase|nr:M15 family metallopeptidase [Thermoanaerobaculia bacterium]
MRKFVALLLIAAACATAHPPVVKSMAEYDRLVASDPDKRLVEITDIPRDVRYATTDNFMHQQLYPVAKVFLRRPAAIALHDVERELAREGLGLKLFDGYRPYRVTVRMWKPIRNPDFVADPAKGSRHNRGAAVDLTLIDLRTGRELPMPTGYDAFTPKARQDFNDLPANAIANRAKLRDVMTRHGFDPLPSEWWHFDFRGWQKFELLDLPLENL